ncbi:MAG: phosphoglycerate kinase [Candidatus ainarchaeum sp.]|nr:phosphoglycerate kinase [Candidatus ainarchaeum sp.]
MKRINDVDVKGKTIAIRIDINLPMEKGEIKLNKRILEHAKTLKELSEKGARIVVLGHQGKKGKEDFISLRKHAKILEKLLGKEVKFSDLKDWESTNNEILNLKNGEILVLENVRFFEEETEHPFDAKFIIKLSVPCDYFVLDALSVAHREHASVVGLTKKLKSFMGNVLEREINALKKLHGEEKVTFIVGGSKLKDSIKIIKYWLENGKVDKLLIGGAPAILFLKAKLGSGIGEENEKYLKSIDADLYFEDVKKMLEKYERYLEIPNDAILDVDGRRVEFEIGSSKGSVKTEFPGAIRDIGPKTIEKYRRIIMDAKVIVMNGPMGMYEKEEFETGTRRILEAIANSKGYSLIGGGHTSAAVEKFGIREDNFSYISLSGKAFLEYLSGKELPGLVGLGLED